MPKKPWTELTDLEKREVIALRLGAPLGPCNDSHLFEEFNGEGVVMCTRCQWSGNRTQLPHPHTYPDWPTNDGLAFAEVWPKICALDFNAAILPSHGMTSHGKPSVIVNEESFVSDTWAAAICAAAYELLEEPK